MEKKKYTTAEYIPWDKATALVRHLYNDGDFRMSLLVGCGIMFGLRFSDLSRLTWDQIMADEFSLFEKKTGKYRTIKVNDSFKRHIMDCHKALGISGSNQQPCFLNRFGNIVSIQMVNRKLKEYNVRYRLNVKHVSSHALRKSFGRHVVEMAGENSEMALIKLSEIFGHTSVRVTRIYLGLRQQELEEIYDSLDF